MYDFEIPRIIEAIKKNRYRRVMLQFPEGLKDYATQVAGEIESKTSCQVVISANPSYGACDVADEEASQMRCDALFHFGHAKMLSKTALPVHYIEVKIDADVIPLLEKNLHMLPKKLGLVTTIQHAHSLAQIKKFLEQQGFEVHTGGARGRARCEGQVLGCAFGTARSIAEKVEGFLYVGSGNFHPLGVAIATGKRTLCVDIINSELRDLTEFKDKILRQRIVRVARAKEAKSFGIIVGEKKGQRRLGLAQKIKEKLEKLGIEAYIISLREITPETLLPFRKLDAFVNTACPRVTIDDAQRYKQPMLTHTELEIALGEREWDDYLMDEMD